MCRVSNESDAQQVHAADVFDFASLRQIRGWCRALNAMSARWAIHIDVEGFGVKWDDTMDAFAGINALMLGIFRIGEFVYPDPPRRLFAHQFGDGFLITSDYPEHTFNRAAQIAIGLLRFVLSNGAIAKAAISEGDLSDIVGCYPSEINRREQLGRLRIGAGIMTVFPVMGSALINAVHVDKKSPKGPMLTISAEHAGRVSLDIERHEVESDLVVLNWLRGEPEGLLELQTSAELDTSSEDARINQLMEYFGSNPGLKSDWKENAKRYLLGDGI